MIFSRRRITLKTASQTAAAVPEAHRHAAPDLLSAGLPARHRRELRDQLSRIAVATVAAVAMLSLAACQPLPQPFKDDRPPPGAPILKLKDGAGIQVGAINGVDDAVAARLAEAMAEALRQADVPASTQVRNRASYILTAAAAAQPAGASSGRTAIEVKWMLAAPDGKTAGDYTQRLEAAAEPWRAGDPALMTTMARAGAPQIAMLLQDEPATQAQPV